MLHLDIRPECEAAREQFKRVWKKLNATIKSHSELSDYDLPALANWQPHNWSQEIVQGREKLVAWDGDSLAGFLYLRTDFVSSKTSSRLIYVENIATSPGNLDTRVWGRRLKYVGLSLLAFACHRSVEDGLGGRIGLHSVSEAVSFYKMTNDKFQLFEISEEVGVDGTLPQHAEMPYFESSQDGAAALLKSLTP